MNSLADPRNATPASDVQRNALCDGYRVLGGTPNARRRRSSRSVHVDRLDASGLDRALLHWMHFQGHLHQFHTVKRSRTSAVRAVVSALFGPNSSFTLTEAGHAFAARLLAVGSGGDLVALPMGDLAPRYDCDAREFSWGAHMLKRYRQHAVNQELVLRAFEEDAWRAWVDDPLPPESGIEPTERVHNTIKDLNRHQKFYLVHFKGTARAPRLVGNYVESATKCSPSAPPQLPQAALDEAMPICEIYCR